MARLLGVEVAAGGYTHGLMFFGTLLVVFIILALTGKSAAGIPERIVRVALSRDQEQLRYWLDTAKREDTVLDPKACRAIASVYVRRLLDDDDVSAALRQRYESERKG